MIYSENTFNAPISCISLANDRHYYLGFENGDIACIEILNNNLKIIHSGYIARIYDVVEENDSTLLVGIRDNGLVKMVGDSIVRTYSIGKNYAPYDICKNERGDIYIGTSSGIYQLVEDSLILILTEEKYKEYKVNQLCIYNDCMLYAATEKGVLVLKKKDGKYETSLIDLIPEKIIFHFQRSNDLLYVTSEEKVYVIDMRTGEAKPVKTKSKDNLFAFFTETIDTNAHWELTATAMNYWDKNGCSSFSIPGRLNRNYKNYVSILNDDFIVLSFEYRLYTFSRHQNTKGESVHVIATHIHNDSVDNKSKDILYFITNDNYLYSCPITFSELIPQKMGKHKLEIDEMIIKLCSSKDFLWVITNNCLRQINRKTGKLTASIEFDDGTDLRCMYVDNKYLFIGSRKWLFRIKDPDNCKITKESLDTLKSVASIKNADLYVTDIYKGIDGFYFATLNNGLCVLNSEIITSVNTYKDVGNINKTGYLLNKGLYLYTSIGFFSQKEKNGNEKSEFTFVNTPIIDYHNQYISMVLKREIKDERGSSISGGLFIIGYKGIGIVNLEGDTFTEVAKISFLDMQFKAAAIAEYEGAELFLGTQTGLYRYKEGNLIPVKIPDAVNFSKIIVPGISATALVFLIVFMYFCFFVRRLKTLKSDMENHEKKIGSNVRKENQAALLDKQKTLRERIDTIKQISIFKLGKKYISIKEIKLEIECWRQNIEYNLLKREEIIEENKKLISRMLEIIEKYNYLFDDLMIEEKLEKIRSKPNSITINSSYDDLEEIVNVTNCLFDTINKYLPKHYKDLEEKLEEDLKKIEELVNSPNISYKDLRQICNPFIKEYGEVFLSELKFMKEGNRKAFNAILICTKLTNKRIDSLLEQGTNSRFRCASTYYDEMEKRCKVIKANYFSAKLINSIKGRRRDKNRK
ncbi:MAG: hypothetical protein LBE13_18345 [Bacteroidales bacterium]|jgi:hypothetical protein|nr:hypothetical protein [Bacteroidales bacterium]